MPESSIDCSRWTLVSHGLIVFGLRRCTDADLAMAMELAEREARSRAGAPAPGTKEAIMAAPVRQISNRPARKLYGAGDWEQAAADEAVERAAEARARAERAEATGEDGEAEDEEHTEAYMLTRGTVLKHDKAIASRHNVRQLERDFALEAGGLSEVKGVSGRGLRLSNRVASDLRRHFAKKTVKGVRASGRVDAGARATRDGVLDEATRMILFRLVTVGAVSGVSGVLRSGKEASVLHGTDWAGVDDAPFFAGMPEDEPSVVGAHAESVALTEAASTTGDSTDLASAALATHEEEGEAENDAEEVTAEDLASAAAMFGDDLPDLTSRVGSTSAECGAAPGAVEAEVEGEDEDEDDKAPLAAETAAGVAAELEAATARAAADSEGSELPEVAIKVFRTTLNEFSNRFDYMDGDRRFRHARRVRHQNPRKLVKLWGRKEYANLHRIHKAGLPCPKPRLCRQNVLVMDFLGADGWPAPQLREAQIKKRSTWRKAYEQTVSIMHGMWHCARLVHGDLSEFNLLWHDGRVWVIDVGQSMDVANDKAPALLELDAANITEFFARQGVATLPTDALVELVRDDTIRSVFRPRRAADVRHLQRVEALQAAEEADAAASRAAAAGAKDADADDAPTGTDGGLVGSGEDNVVAKLRQLIKAHKTAARKTTATVRHDV